MERPLFLGIVLLLDWDIALFRQINSHWTNGWLDRFALAMDHPWWLWAPLGVLMLWLLVKGDNKARFFLLFTAIAVILTDVICAQIFKPLIARPRPCVELDGVRTLLGIKTSLSMPSNHAANTAAAAAMIGMEYKRWLVPAALVALWVGYSRIYLGVHYPSDVFLGYAIGLTVAAFVLEAKTRIESIE